jgi:hypothetical protein
VLAVLIILSLAISPDVSARETYKHEDEYSVDYTVRNGKATIVEVYDGLCWDDDSSLYSTINIPAELGGYPVTAIGYRSFVSTLAESITLPDSVTTVGRGAFSNVPIRNITLSNNLVTIGDRAFYGCYWLKNIIIPSSVGIIGDEAFLDCTALIEIYFEGSLPAKLGKNIFKNAPKNLTLYCPVGDSSWDEIERDGYPGVARVVRYVPKSAAPPTPEPTPEPEEPQSPPKTSDDGSLLLWLLLSGVALLGLRVVKRKLSC